MASTKRYVDLKATNNNILVTGLSASPQTIAFSSLKDEDGTALPTTFNAIPFVDVVGSWQQADAVVVPANITTTNFEIYLSSSRAAGVNSGHFKLIVIGD